MYKVKVPEKGGVPAHYPDDVIAWLKKNQLPVTDEEDTNDAQIRMDTA